MNGLRANEEKKGKRKTFQMECAYTKFSMSIL